MDESNRRKTVDEQAIVLAVLPAERADLVSKRKRSRRRIVLYVLTGLFGLCLTGFFGLHLYLQIAEWRDPSGRVYVDTGGTRVYLEQPQEIVTPRPLPTQSNGVSGVATTPPSASPTSAETTSPITNEPDGFIAGDPRQTPLPTSDPVALPPLQLQIPSLELDVPVVLSDSQNLPRVPVAGWFFKSAFPATAGNTVLIGHVNGKAAIFERLDELDAGDEIRVITEHSEHVYVVESKSIVGAHETDVLLPTDDSVVTLITCTGDWLPQTRTFTHRLVVRGYYADVQ